MISILRYFVVYFIVYIIERHVVVIIVLLLYDSCGRTACSCRNAAHNTITCVGSYVFLCKLYKMSRCIVESLIIKFYNMHVASLTRSYAAHVLLRARKCLYTCPKWTLACITLTIYRRLSWEPCKFHRNGNKSAFRVVVRAHAWEWHADWMANIVTYCICSL